MSVISISRKERGGAPRLDAVLFPLSPCRIQRPRFGALPYRTLFPDPSRRLSEMLSQHLGYVGDRRTMGTVRSIARTEENNLPTPASSHKQAGASGKRLGAPCHCYAFCHGTEAKANVRGTRQLLRPDLAEKHRFPNCPPLHRQARTTSVRFEN